MPWSSNGRHGRACPGHPRSAVWSERKAWMPGTRPGMTTWWMPSEHHDLFFRQLQLDAAVALVRIFGIAAVERLKLGKAGRDQPLRRHAKRDQVLHHRDRARGGQFP